MNTQGKEHSRRKFLNNSCLGFSALLMPSLPFAREVHNESKYSKRSIPTVSGEVVPAEMGVTLMHEHLLFFNGTAPNDPGYQPIPENLRDDSVNFVVDMLRNAKRVGIDTIVDVGPYRPIDLYQQISKQSTVNIIISTGFYRQSTRPARFVAMNDENEMVDYMLKEVQEGVDNSGIKAGIIKIAQQHRPLSDWETKVFRAAARVQKKTGVRIATHTGNAVEQFRLLMKCGADPAKIYFSHTDVGRHGNVGDLVELLKEGAYVETDTFGQTFYTDQQELTRFIRSICDAGYSKQLFISIDSNWHWAKGERKFEGSEAPHFDKNASNRTFPYMVTDVIPFLLKSGFSITEIKTFLVDNPRAYFSNK